MSEWSDWIEMEQAKSRRGPLNDFGVYQIRAVSPASEPIPIRRLVGDDQLGLLYVGRSGYRSQAQGRRTIANRIREFVNQRHSGGKTYAKANAIMQTQSPFVGHRLQVRAQFLPDGLIDMFEAEVLRQYFSIHAELPPCNSQSSNARESESGDSVAVTVQGVDTGGMLAAWTWTHRH